MFSVYKYTLKTEGSNDQFAQHRYFVNCPILNSVNDKLTSYR